MQDSIGNNHNWQTVDEIVIPSSQEQLMPYGMPKTSSSQAAMQYKTWHPVFDSVAKAREDSIVRAVNDSLAHIQSGYGIIIEAPYTTKLESPGPANQDSSHGLSWIFVVLGLLFFMVCMKLKNAPGYLMTLLSDAKDVRIRHSMFDNTVKETSFLIILIVTWICCAGIMLWELVRFAGGMPFVPEAHVIPNHTLRGVELCAGVAAVYVIFMLLSYELIGMVFSDRMITRLWVKGAAAGMGLQALAFFPLALVALCYPAWDAILLWIGAAILGIGKILFIYKGFRIFFQQIRSWLLFLCYLCSLEIVPLILAYLLAYQICVEWV